RLGRRSVAKAGREGHGVRGGHGGWWPGQPGSWWPYGWSSAHVGPPRTGGGAPDGPGHRGRRPRRCREGNRGPRAGQRDPRRVASVILDAPAEVLIRRKGEHDVETLERWRRGYRAELGRRGGTVIASDAPPEQTLRAASAVVWRALCERRGWSAEERAVQAAV